MNLPSDAVGTTDAVSEVILLGADNQLPSEDFELPVDLSVLNSGSDRRDGYVGRNTLAPSGTKTTPRPHLAGAS